MKIDGQAAVVTGGASGLGAATARALTAAGAKVALFDLNGELGEPLAREIGGLFQECDVASEDSARAAFAGGQAAHGPARILVNCAGIGTFAKTMRRAGVHSLELFEQVVRVNLTGSFNCCRLAAEAMAGLDPDAGGERGVIVNTASIAGLEGTVGSVAYAASKAGVAGMTLPMARDLAGLGIRVVAIAPGGFETPMYRGMPAATEAAMLADQAFPKRLGKPAEYAALARQIVENPMLNGEVVRIDAGIRFRPVYA